jgi:hypothetical protein
MSTTHSAASADSARGPSVDGDWLAIPRLTGVLLWRHWPALLFWFLMQRVSYDVTMALAIKLAESSVLLSFAALSTLVVFQLIGTIAMFHVLRPSLPSATAREMPTPLRFSRDETMTRVLAIALLPFFAYYAAWGFLDGIKRDFRLDYLFSIWYDRQENLDDIFSIRGLWIALIVAWFVRHLSRRRAQRTGHTRWSIIATICEAYWVFVGVVAVGKLIGLGKAWWHDRVVYQAVAQWWENPFIGWLSLEPLKRIVDPLWDLVTTVASAATMPLIWLAIAALIYGLDLKRRHRLDAADARLRQLGAHYNRMHAVWKRAADKLTAGWTSKGVPVINSIRLVLRAGVPALAMLCIGWQLLAFVDAWAWRCLVNIIGPHEFAWWNVIGHPLALLFNGPYSMRPALFTEMIRVTLLAATFGIAIVQLHELKRSD